MEGQRGRLAALYSCIVMFAKGFSLSQMASGSWRSWRTMSFTPILTSSCRLMSPRSALDQSPTRPPAPGPRNPSLDITNCSCPGAQRLYARTDFARLHRTGDGNPNVHDESIEEIKGMWRRVQ